MTPAEDFGQLRLKFTDPIQHDYEAIRPIVLFSKTIAERSRQTGIERTVISLTLLSRMALLVWRISAPAPLTIQKIN